MKKQIDTSWQYPGAISPDFVYTTRELVGRLGWSAEDVSLACSKGLRTHVFADHVYVFGSDVIAFLKQVNPRNYGTAVVSQEAAE
jgi:hypothetical protein